MWLLVIFLFMTISAMEIEPVLYRTQQKPGEEAKSSICWPRDANLRRVIKSDCDPLLESLKSLGKKDGLMHFSRDANRGYQLPHRMQSGTCFIEINFIKAGEIGPEEEDDSTFTEAIETVETVIRICIERPSSGAVGGGYVIGKLQRMLVFVEGRPPKTEKKKDYMPSHLPVTRPPQRKKRPQKFQPQQPQSQVLDTPHGVVLELPFSLEEMEEMEEQQRKIDRLALAEKLHKPK